MKNWELRIICTKSNTVAAHLAEVSTFSPKVAYGSSTLEGKKWRWSYQGGGGGSQKRSLSLKTENFKSFVLNQIRTVAVL